MMEQVTKVDSGQVYAYKKGERDSSNNWRMRLVDDTDSGSQDNIPEEPLH